MTLAETDNQTLSSPESDISSSSHPLDAIISMVRELKINPSLATKEALGEILTDLEDDKKYDDEEESGEGEDSQSTQGGLAGIIRTKNGGEQE